MASFDANEGNSGLGFRSSGFRDNTTAFLDVCKGDAYFLMPPHMRKLLEVG